MDRETREARELFKKLSFRAKIDHIWHYYKWRIIVITILAISIPSTIIGIMNRPDYDVEIGMYTYKYVSQQKIDALEEYISQYVEDINGDGIKNVKIYSASISLAGDTPQGQDAMQNKFVSEMTAGVYGALIFDDVFYEIMQYDSYRSAVDDFRDFDAVNELDEIMVMPDETKFYWSTRAIYDAEKKKEKRLQEYNGILKTEENIFGKR